MRFKFGIREKISFGYIILIGLLIIIGIFVFSGFRNGKSIDNLISNVFLPSLKSKSNLVYMVENTPKHLNSWVYTSNKDDRAKLETLTASEYPELKQKLLKLFAQLENEKDLKTLNEIILDYDKTLESVSKVLASLATEDDFNNDVKVDESITLLEDQIIPLIQSIQLKLDNLSNFEEITTILLANKHEKQRILELILRLGIIVGIILAIIISFVIVRNITEPLKRLQADILRFSEGDLSETEDMKISSDEVGEMVRSVNKLMNGLRDTAFFATEIGKGNLDMEFKSLSDKDVLGNALLEMRMSLKDSAEKEDKRKFDDQKRTWANEGLAQFGNILRQDNDELQDLSDSIIRFVVKYLGANQGGIFLWNEDDKDDQYFELVSSFAWDRKKYVTKRIEKGEGLVGACGMEKETIFLTAVPEDYVEITSGLGGANPRCVILVPLKLENQVLGVIELASFKQIEKHQIEFLEKIGESIASTISSVRINSRTKALLEQSQQQSEEMAAQEEEMRQNMEELQATQEESARKSSEMESLMNALNSSSYVIEYDLDKRVTAINDAYLDIHGMKREEVIGLYHHDNMDFTEEQWTNYEKFWADLKNGIVKKDKSIFDIKGDKHILLEVFTPIKDDKGVVYKVMKIANDITEYVK